MKTFSLANKNVLVTAGPTQEAIDPVRYISNQSSGKMGYAIAETFLSEGANVFLISGPTCLHLEHPNLQLVKVKSAYEMYMACCRFVEAADVIIYAAAVADYLPAKVASQKIKKQGDEFFIRLIKNIDIALELGADKKPHQVAVGFALETENEFNNAVDKLSRKNFDMIVLNSMNDPQATFGYDTNKITIIKRDAREIHFPLKNKADVAKDILNEVACIMKAKAAYSESWQLN